MARRPVFRAVAAALAVLSVAGPASAKEWRTVRIGTEGAYPPFNFIDSDRNLQGFDVDVARAICEHEKVTCEFAAQDWDGLIPALLAGKYDAIFASMSITAERRQVIAFSDRYYASPSLFVAPKDGGLTDVSPQALAGKTIGAQTGTVNARYLDDVYQSKGVEVKLYATQDEANLDLASGRIDAVLADKLVMLPWLEKSAEGQCCQVVGMDLTDPGYFGEGIGAGMRKGDMELKTLIDRGIADIRADGTYGRINAKYFPFSLY